MLSALAVEKAFESKAGVARLRVEALCDSGSDAGFTNSSLTASVEKSQQEIIVAIRINKGRKAWNEYVVAHKSRSRAFVKRSVAAGQQRDESIRQRRHERPAFVHACQMLLRQASMSNLAVL